MRFARAQIHGYGRLRGRLLEFSPGFQIILGPNEQGKTTLRDFLTDMLYGQLSGANDSPEEASTLRRPWESPGEYGGSLDFAKDNGVHYRIERDFNAATGSASLRDADGAAHDPNGVGEAMLGLGKKVFLATANIGHFSLESLGDEEALKAIRARLRALTESGDERRSSDAALQWLDRYIDGIGRQNAPGKPLTLARDRLNALQEDINKAKSRRREVERIETALAACLLEQARIESSLSGLHAQLEWLDEEALQARLEEIESLDARINEATQQTFSVSSAREFPLERAPDVQRLENLVNTARRQLERSQTERQALTAQIQHEREKLGAAAPATANEIDAEQEERLAQLESELIRLRERLDVAEQAHAITENKLYEAQGELARLPDFSQLAPDPLEWLNNLASTYALAQSRRDEARERLRKIKDEENRRRALLAAPARVFEDGRKFLEEARAHEIAARVLEEQGAQLRARVEQLNIDAEDHEERAPGFGVMAFICGVGFVITMSAAVMRDILGVYFAAALFGLAFTYFLSGMIYARSAARKTRSKIAAVKAEVENARAQLDEREQSMKKRIAAAGCNTLREMEALCEKYEEDAAKLAAVAVEREEQERLAASEEHQANALYADLAAQLQRAGESLKEEADIGAATARAMSRFQEYRDVKRRVYEGRQRLTTLQSELEQARRAFDQCSQEELALSLEVRELLRRYEFQDEKRFTSALTAMRAYRTRYAQIKHKRGRIEALQEKLTQLEAQLEPEQRDLARHEADLDKALRAAGVRTMAEWRERAEQARIYQEAWARRSALVQERDALTRNLDLRELLDRPNVEAPVDKGKSREELDAAVAELGEAMAQAKKRSQTLTRELNATGASARTLNEIEEDLEIARVRAAELERERDAAAYAAATIEEIARARQARYAPKLAELASEHLKTVTGGAYEELRLGVGLSISVRPAAREGAIAAPEKRLSKGAVDQIYFVLRVALVQILSHQGESIPILLDDPFANYDDDRLRRALELLSGLAQRHQIVLFTCREDVAQAARQVNAPVLEL